MASLMAIFRQVAREGARWGLVPVLRRDLGKVQVCEMVSEQTTNGGITCPVKRPRPIMSLDESSPMDAWSMVLMHRLRREHHDFMKLVRNRQDRLKREQQAEIAQRGADLRRKLEALARRRVISTGIGR